jgi:hypothetical protein
VSSGFFAGDVDSVLVDSPLLSLGNAFKCPQHAGLCKAISKLSDSVADGVCFLLVLDKDDIQSDTSSLAILNTTIHLTH